VSSFLPEVLDRTQSIDRQAPLGFIFDRQSHNPPSHLDLEWTIPHFKLVSRELVEEAHGSGEKIMVWTVNRAADVQRLIEWGTDAIISDDTELLGGLRR
jgi:glycerophosphoryl diester phosphodiesterase